MGPAVDKWWILGEGARAATCVAALPFGTL
jgi:hypothetical protein